LNNIVAVVAVADTDKFGFQRGRENSPD